MGPSGTEPIFKSKVGADTVRQINGTIEKAKASLPRYRDYYGFVGEVKPHQKFDATIGSGQVLKPLEPVLRKGIGSRSKEVAAEAQMLFDALERRKKRAIMVCPL